MKAILLTLSILFVSYPAIANEHRGNSRTDSDRIPPNPTTTVTVTKKVCLKKRPTCIVKKTVHKSQPYVAPNNGYPSSDYGTGTR